MITRWQWALIQLSRRLGFRAALFCLLAVVTPFVALVVGPVIPESLPADVGAQAVDRVLGIIASSMLAVTTFSVATMVAAFSAASNSVTPRATELLMQEPATQNALATFIGSFLFSLVGIITLSAGLYDQRGQLVLFVVTIIVIAFVVVMLLKWIDHLSRLGRVGETIDRVEEAVTSAMRSYAAWPHMGGCPLLEETDIPQEARPIFSRKIGYVQNIDMQTLCRAGPDEMTFYIRALPGSFVNGVQPLVMVTGPEDENLEKKVCAAFTVGDRRNFQQDPRFGLVVLAEIASRALSPAVNDPGTAIDVIGTAVRVLSIQPETKSKENEEGGPRFPNIHVPSIPAAELFDDVFTSIARDGAGLVEVGIILQKAFRALAEVGGRDYADMARRQSGLALARARAAKLIEADMRRLESHAISLNEDPAQK